MPIKEWKHPIHQKQKGEPPRQRHYLEQFYQFPGTLKDFSDLLKYTWQKKYGKCDKTERKFEEYLKENPVTFYVKDIENGPPSYSQLMNWSGGNFIKCDEKYTWDERRTDKINEICRRAEEDIAKKISEQIPYIYKEVIKGLKEIDTAVNNSKSQGKFNPTQAEYATRGRSHVVDDLQKLSGKDKDYKLKADVDSNNTVQYQGVNNLLEAFYVSKAEWDKRKQSKQ